MNQLFTILDHLEEAEKNRLLILNAVNSAYDEKLPDEVKQSLSTATIYLLGQGVQLDLALEKVRGKK